jgi:hypothetical protein
MIRLEKTDFESPATLAALAAEAKMTPHQFREHYEHVVSDSRGELPERRMCPVVMTT